LCPSAGTRMKKTQIAPIVLSIWLTIVAAFMLLFQQFKFEIFFVLTLLSILVIAELIKDQYIKPVYQRYLNYLISAGIIIFGAIVVQKVLEILGLEIVFQ
jgi:type IV secretory pathway TrbL component